MQEQHPGAPVYALMRGIRAIVGDRQLEICPVGIVDDFIDSLINIEALCEIYKVLPYEGGLLEQPEFIMDAFSVIRSTRNFYDETKAKDKEK